MSQDHEGPATRPHDGPVALRTTKGEHSMKESAYVGSAGRPGQWTPEIRARYGVRERPRWLIAMAAFAAACLLAIGTWYAWERANPDITAGLSTFRVISDDHVEITFDVVRELAKPAVCVVRARAVDGFDVGYAEVALPAQSGRTTHTYQLRTAYRALVAELLGCGLGGAPAGLPGPQFRPGVLPPEQPWTPPAGS